MAKRYTDAEKARAVALYAELGPTAVQAQLGILKGTVTRWAQAAGVETVSPQRNRAAVEAAQLKWTERRAVMVEEIGAVAHMALMRVEQSIAGSEQYPADPKDAKDYATTMAILVDKAQLLGGDATTRHENRELRDRLLGEAREHAQHLRSVA